MLSFTRLVSRVASCPSITPMATMASGPGRVPVTLIPGDGVGPEIMDSAQEVLQAMGAKVDFEEVYFSEVNRAASMPINDVMDVVKRNKVALRGVIGIPEETARPVRQRSK